MNICVTSSKSKIFEFIWSHIFTTRNAENMGNQNVDHLWSNYNLLVLRVRSSSRVCFYCDGLALRVRSSSDICCYCNGLS